MLITDSCIIYLTVTNNKLLFISDKVFFIFQNILIQVEDEDAPEPCLTKPSAAAASSEEVENLRRQVNKRDHIDM